MHVLGHYGKENAAAIFELFLECMAEYPLDKPDNEGNTGRETPFLEVVLSLFPLELCLVFFSFGGFEPLPVLLQFCCWPT